MSSSKKKTSQRFGRLRQRKWLIIATLVGLLLAVSLLGGYLGDWGWVGIGGQTMATPKDTTYQLPKTLWDWLQLLIVPGALAAGGFWFTTQQRRRQVIAEETQRKRDAQEAEERREEDERLAQEKRRDDVLAAYFDRMSNLLLQHELSPSSPRNTARVDPENESEEELVEPAVNVVARALTVSTMRQLDGGRNGLLMGFLRDLGLLTPNLPVISLAGANLEDVDLTTVDLEAVDLAGAYLSGASLQFAYLKRANLEDANLDMASFLQATLEEAVMARADLEDAHLDQADLSRANLAKANLTGASLKGAKLVGANLRKARLEKADLKEANLEGADLRGATYTKRYNDSKSTIDFVWPTEWPAGFDPVKAGAIAVD